jgi:hypothetical protein
MAKKPLENQGAPREQDTPFTARHIQRKPVGTRHSTFITQEGRHLRGRLEQSADRIDYYYPLVKFGLILPKDEKMVSMVCALSN